MKSRKIIGVLLSALFVFSMVSVSFAADSSFKKFGVRVRGIYIMPDENIPDAPGVKIEDAATPELDLEYFFTKNFSTELVLALSKHDINAGGQDIGNLWLLPPSLFVKFHPMPDFCVSPYIGVGMNVVMPFDEHLNGDPTFKVDTSVGWAVKVGADIPVGKNFYLNVDGMYYNTETDATIAGGKHRVDVNPFIVGTGIGYRF